MPTPKKATKKATKKTAKDAPRVEEPEEPKVEMTDLEWLEARPDVIESAWLYLDSATDQEHQRLITQLATAKRMVDNANTKTRAKRASYLKSAEAELAAFEEILISDGLARRFDFTLIGADRVDRLEWEHPPTPAQVARAKAYFEARSEPFQDPGVDIDGHSIALIAESSHTPKLDQEQVRAMWFSNKIGPRERASLTGAARRAQGYRDDSNQLAELVNLLGVTG